jgi:hypothetical protein
MFRNAAWPVFLVGMLSGTILMGVVGETAIWWKSSAPEVADEWKDVSLSGPTPSVADCPWWMPSAVHEWLFGSPMCSVEGNATYDTCLAYNGGNKTSCDAVMRMLAHSKPVVSEVPPTIAKKDSPSTRPGPLALPGKPFWGPWP